MLPRLRLRVKRFDDGTLQMLSGFKAALSDKNYVRGRWPCYSMAASRSAS